jgi:hypothetical protein
MCTLILDSTLEKFPFAQESFLTGKKLRLTHAPVRESGVAGEQAERKTEFMQQPWQPQSKKGFWDVLPGKNLPKFCS